MTLGSIGEAAHHTAVNHGFRGENAEPPNLERELLLIHTEISEATEELRNGRDVKKVEVTNGYPEGFAIELADAVIRIAETCYHHGVPLDEAVQLKMQYNDTRPFKHGGKKY